MGCARSVRNIFSNSLVGGPLQTHTSKIKTAAGKGGGSEIWKSSCEGLTRMRTVKETRNCDLREKGEALRDGLEVSPCTENQVSKKHAQFDFVSRHDSSNNNSNNDNHGRWQRGVRKKEIQQ